MNTVTIVSFVLFTALVAVLTWLKTRGGHLGDSQDGYYLGGRTLTWGIIAGSMLLTNLNATNFVGLSALAYTGNMSAMGWEVPTGITLVIVALFLIPRYLKQGITTIPEFIETRYDKGTKTFITYLFLFGFIVNVLPPALYAGALALVRIFDVQVLFGINEVAAIWILVWGIGLIGTAYAIFGGLKAIAVSDTINGIGLVIGGLAVPIFALSFLGDGSISNGLNQILNTSTEKLNSIGGSGDVVPFATLFTGMFLVNLYYWGTNQAIIQRALGAKSLEHAQKGVLLAGLLKMLTPFIIIIPGVIAFHIYGANAFKNPDMVYSTLVNDVLPKPLVGFFAAVMFGAILSTFNSVLNSASTLFAINLVKPHLGNKCTDEKMVKVGRSFSLIVAVISMSIAPLIMYAPQGLFQYLQMVNGFFNVPIFTVVFIGYVTKKVPALAAKLAMTFFVFVYAVTQLIIKPEMHFLHILAILFVITVLMMLIIGKFFPREVPFTLPDNKAVDTKPWKHRYIMAAIVIIVMILSYVVFSPLILVKDAVSIIPEGAGWAIIAAVLVVTVGCIIRKKYGYKDA